MTTPSSTKRRLSRVRPSTKPIEFIQQGKEEDHHGKSRLATFFKMKSDQAACFGVFHPRVAPIFCALVTSQNAMALPNTAAPPSAKGNPCLGRIGLAHIGPTGDAGEDGDVHHVVHGDIQPGAERGFREGEPRHLAIATIDNGRELKQQRGHNAGLCSSPGRIRRRRGARQRSPPS